MQIQKVQTYADGLQKFQPVETLLRRLSRDLNTMIANRQLKQKYTKSIFESIVHPRRLSFLEMLKKRSDAFRCVQDHRFRTITSERLGKY